MKWQLLVGALVLSIAAPFATAEAQSVGPEQINSASASDKANARAFTAKLQILLDRASFSPGVIDGRMGENVENALAAFRKERGLSSNSQGVDDKTWAELTKKAPDRVVKEYTITDEDVNGPFTKEIPEGFEEKKTLDRLGYTGPAELLAEKFHMDEDFLKELNPGKDLTKAGTTITVANVRREEGGERPKVKRIEVDKGVKQVRAYDEGNKLVAVYPATIGSEALPSPSGTHEVKSIAVDPVYTYNPEYNFEGVKADKPFKIAAGPNNPVGKIWIDLSKEGYGLHGTPEPSKIGKTASHGCVRLTNWDAEALAKMVDPGVKVAFKEGS